MTDAQIALYAAVRVAVPGEWQIRMTDVDGIQLIYLKRPVYAEPSPLPGRQVVGVEELAVAAPLHMITEARARRFVVVEALDQIGAVGEPG